MIMISNVVYGNGITRSQSHVADEDDEVENSAEGFDDFVPAVFAKNADEAEQYRELLEDNDIPAMIGDPDELDDAAPSPRRRRRISRGVPVLAPRGEPSAMAARYRL